MWRLPPDAGWNPGATKKTRPLPPDAGWNPGATKIPLPLRARDKNSRGAYDLFLNQTFAHGARAYLFGYFRIKINYQRSKHEALTRYCFIVDMLNTNW